MFHQVQILGYLGSDVEMRYTNTGTPVSTFSVATSKRYTTNGEKREETTWFRITCWRQKAEFVSTYFKKGDPIMIFGEIKASAYINKDGQAVASLELTANDVHFLPNPKRANANGNGAAQPVQAGPAPVTDDDDIPF